MFLILYFLSNFVNILLIIKYHFVIIFKNTSYVLVKLHKKRRLHF